MPATGANLDGEEEQKILLRNRIRLLRLGFVHRRMNFLRWKDVEKLIRSLRHQMEVVRCRSLPRRHKKEQVLVELNVDEEQVIRNLRIRRWKIPP